MPHDSGKLPERKGAVAVGLLLASILLLWTLWVVAKTALPSPSPVASSESGRVIARTHPECRYSGHSSYASVVRHRSLTSTDA